MESLQRHTFTWAGVLFLVSGLVWSSFVWWGGLVSLVIGALFLRRGLQLKRAWRVAESAKVD